MAGGNSRYSRTHHRRSLNPHRNKFLLVCELQNGAVERTRTSTVLLPPAPQAGASASSATTAFHRRSDYSREPGELRDSRRVTINSARLTASSAAAWGQVANSTEPFAAREVASMESVHCLEHSANSIAVCQIAVYSSAASQVSLARASRISPTPIRPAPRLCPYVVRGPSRTP